MASQFSQLSTPLSDFITRQHIFFVATAPAEGRVNCSPKGMDSLKVLSPTRLVWLNVTGSGNETAAHVLENSRMTLMWCSFDRKPLILRAYGTARAVYPEDTDWAELAAELPELPGARQIYDMQIEMVQTSCGYAVPFMEFKETRERLNEWAAKTPATEMDAYREKKNMVSIDGLPTK